MSLVNRAVNILKQPREEWGVIAGERPDQGAIITGYALPLALIPAVATLLGWGLVGVAGYRDFTFGIGSAVMVLIGALASLFIGTYVVNALAPTFNSRQDIGRAFQLVAYSMTPTWVAGILTILPGLQMIAWIGSLYTFYLFYLGVSPLMETPVDKRFPYVIASFVVIFIIYFLIVAVLSGIVLGMLGMAGVGSAVIAPR